MKINVPIHSDRVSFAAKARILLGLILCHVAGTVYAGISTSTSGPDPAVATVGASVSFNFTATSTVGNITEMEVAWRTPSGAIYALETWFGLGGNNSSETVSRSITFNQGPGTYEVWANARDDAGGWCDPWAQGLPAMRLPVTVSGPANAPPVTTAINVSPLSVVRGQSVTIFGSATDGDANLSALQFFVNDPNASGWVFVGTEAISGGAASTSHSWSVPTNAVVGTWTAYIRASDASGAWDSGLTMTFAVSAGGSNGTGTGLTGQYYDNMDFTALALTRTDATVDFPWGNNPPPGVSIGADTFSVRWTGQVQPRYSEVYTFKTTSDDGVRLWVNNQQIINNWTDHGDTVDSGTITLTQNQKYDIRMDFYENSIGATARLGWQSASQAYEIIPQSQLYTTTTEFAPIFSAHPSNVSVSAPSAATFSVAASGSPSPGYQWQQSTNSGGTWSNISGATGSAYSTGATSAGMNGYQYRCVATNSAGSATSNVATLSVTSGGGSQVTGGEIVQIGSDYIHWFGSGGTFTVPSGTTLTNARVLIVGGGGGGGSGGSYGGGGGGGGGAVVSLSGQTITAGSYGITIGSGGQGGPATDSGYGANGSVSMAFGNTALGGGGGGGYVTVGQSGGTGGGSGRDAGASQGGTGSQGGGGGSAIDVSWASAGGGGGAGGAGNNGDYDFTGHSGTSSGGGPGMPSDISGLFIYYGGGGGGAWETGGGPAPVGGIGGGGAGSNGGGVGAAGTSGYGGGGGGGQWAAGGNGGSGVVIVRYTLQGGGLAPTFAVHPSSQSVTAPNAATFLATASGNPTPTYQWQLSTNGGGSWSGIGGATSSSYSTGTTSTGMNGYQYRCVASNSSGSATSNAATLSVTGGGAAPTFSVHPSSQSVTAPNAATFSATASGNPTPTYQWQSSTNNGASWSDLSGATSSTYSTGTTSTGMNGYQYRCIGSNSSGSATSNAATLSVTGGGGADITTGLVGHWKFDEGTGNAALDSSGYGRHGVLSGPTWASGRIGSGALSFDGNDEVVVSGLSTNGGPITISFWTNTPSTQVSSLFGFDGPDTTQRAQAHVPWADGTMYWDYGNIGGNGRLTASFSSHLGTWTHVTLVSAGSSGNFKAIYLNGALANSSNVSDGAALSTLRIGRLLESGYYHTGTIDEFRIYNRVLAAADVAALYAYTGSGGTAPQITTQPTNQSVTAPNAATFSVTASGNPSPTYQWQLSTNNGASWSGINGATSSTYSTGATTGLNGYQYRCVATNAAGSTPSNAATLTVVPASSGNIELLIHRP